MFMKDIIFSQLDYIYFFFGFAYLMLASVTFSLIKQRKSSLPWHWFCLFALAQCLLKWCDFAGVEFGANTALLIFSEITKLLSFTFLFEFARIGLRDLKIKIPGRWLYAVIGLVIINGAYFYGLFGFKIALRYSLVLPAGILTSILFAAAYRNNKPQNIFYLLYSVLFISYAIATGLIAPNAAFFPATIINDQSFLNCFQIPIFCLRGFLGICMAIIMILYVHRLNNRSINYSFKLLLVSRYLPMLGVLALIIGGWFITDYTSKQYDLSRKHEFLHLSSISASSIQSSTINSLTGTSQDVNSSTYLNFKKHLVDIHSELNNDKYQKNCRFVYLLGFRDNKVFFFADSEPPSSKDYSPPGQDYNDASEELIQCFTKGMAFIEGPLKDDWGVWVSSIAPVKDENGKVIALLGIDIHAKNWQKDLALLRFFVITTCMMITIIVAASIAVVHIISATAENRLIAIEALDKSRAKYKTLVENLNIGVFRNLPDNDKCFLESNTALAKLFGFDNVEEFQKIPVSDIYQNISDRAKYIKKLQEKGSVKNYELNFRKKDGTPIIASLTAQADFDQQGKITSIFGVVEDITERKAAEEKMKLLNQNLTITNEELRDFVYVASHDLREPLRKITAFGSLLENSIKDMLNEDDSENLRLMIDGAKRMNQVIDGLLSYSRIGTKNREFENVDITEIISDLKQFELSVMIEDTKAIINIPEPLAIVKAEPLQVRQLIQNLLSNAIKFHENGNVPQITITSKPAANEMIRIEIADNGIGIAPEFHSAIFTMFKRLNKREDYDGTGVGLSVCKKIVLRHKGEIGVESQLGKGSIFWFTLPSSKSGITMSINDEKENYEDR